jgi:cytochrome P450
MFQIAAQVAFSNSFPYIAISGVTTIVGILSWRWWKQKNTYKSLRSLPSPPRHLLLGNLPQVLTAVKQKKYFQLLFDWSQQLGPMYVYWTGNPVLVLSQPKVIEETIINGMRDGSLVRSPQANRAWNDIVGPILFGQNGSQWQWRRRAWNLEFSSNSLSKYVDIISQAGAQVIDRLKETTSPTEIQVDPLFVELTMRAISCIVLGIPVDKKSANPEESSLEVLKAYEAMTILSYRFLRVATGEKRWMKYLPTKNSRSYWAARRYLEELVAPKVDLALKMREPNKIALAQISPLFQESMLVKIAAKEPKYNRESLIAEVIELLIAGTDTTAHTLSFAVAELCLNKRVFRQAQAVVDSSWESQGGINTENLKELAYIRAVIKETLRLYSVGSGSTVMDVQRDTIIEGQVIPRGTTVNWSMLAAGRDPEVYPHSEEFLPERWIDKSTTSSPLLNFGSGPHRCLGEHLSMLEATVMLALLLRYFEWELVNGRSSLEQLQQNLLIYPPDGMPMRFWLRK